MKKKFLAIFSFLIIHQFASAQCPISGFTPPSIGCANTPMNFVNTSSGTGVLNYSWDFCTGDFSSVPTGADHPTASGSPIAISLVYDSVNWYGFVTDVSNNHILRYDFGATLANTATGPVDLGNPGNAINGVVGNEISFHYESGNWYAIFAIQTGYRVVTLDFGNSLLNPTPTGTFFVDPLIPSIMTFQDLKTDHDSIFLFVGNDASNNILKLTYANSILNTPVADTIQLAGYSNADDIVLVKTCDHWYGYAVSYSSSTLIKLDFGNSLSNRPAVTDLGNAGGVLFHPTSLTLANDGRNWVAFVNNYPSGPVKIDLGNNISNPVLTGSVVNVPSVTGIGTSVNIAKDGSDFYLFPVGVSSGKFSKIKYAAPCSASPQVSNSSSASGIVYSSGGTYYVGLSASDSSGNISYDMDSVTVNYSPVSNFSVSNTCFGDQTTFIDSTTIQSGTIVSWLWNFGDTDTASSHNATHLYTSTGQDTVSLTTIAGNGCSNTKNTIITIHPLPVAGLSAPPACSETPIQFSDLSTIPSGAITGWLWDFGNSDTSTSQNPAYSYPGGGNFSITLKVTSDAGCTDTASLPLFINYRPQSAFDVTNTCVGQNTLFANQSVSQSPVTSYHWDFGDVITDTVANPSHAYPAVVSTYNVEFIVSAANGCIDTTTRVIKVNNIPVINFSSTPMNACEGNNVVFHDSSTVAGDTISTWFWNFGDFQTDTVQNPVHQYATHGNYTVTLIAYAPTSCGNSSFQNISVIESPVAMFGYAEVCSGSAMPFTDMSTTPTGSSLTAWHWDFGDSHTDTVQNPSHTFQTSGNHVVTLTVTSNFGCTNSDSIVVYVHPLPVASFANTIPCTVNAVQFNNTSLIDTPATIITYAWNFGNPTAGPSFDTSSIQNPTHIFDTTGNFVVRLITTSDFGCMDTAFNVLNVKRASRANFQYLPTCYGNLVQFTNLSTPPGLDTAWFWAFGDTQFNQLENPAHFYTSPVTYAATLTVYATTGCVTSVTKPVTVSPIPIAAFVHSPACIGSAYHFIDSSFISAGSVVAWKWNFAGLDSSVLQNPFFTFPDTGNYTIKLTVTSDIGCTSTIVRTIHVYPLPVANFSFTPQYGNPPLNVSFSNLSTNGSSYQWNFGDGSGTSVLTNPQHLYTDTNLYSIQLITTSQFGCKDSIRKNIYVIKPILDLAITDVSSSVQNNQLQITLDLANLGTRSIDNFKIEAQMENGTRIVESYVQTLPNGYAGQLVLFSKLDLGSGTAKYYCVKAVEPNGSTDDAPSNNELCKSLTKEFSVVNPFPNPFDDFITLQLVLPYKDQLSIELLDMNGRNTIIFEGEGQEGLNQFKTDLSDLANSTYALRFRFREAEIIRTIVKMEKKK